MFAYYDYILVAIPFALLTTGFASFVSEISYMVAVPVGGLAAILVMGHAMFVNGPVNPPTMDGATESSAQITNGPTSD